MEDVKNIIDQVSVEAKASFNAQANDVFDNLKKQFTEQFATTIDSKLKTLLSYDAHGWKSPNIIPLSDILQALISMKKYCQNGTNDANNYLNPALELFNKDYNVIKPVRLAIIIVSNNNDQPKPEIYTMSINGYIMTSQIKQDGYDMPDFIFDLFNLAMPEKAHTATDLHRASGITYHTRTTESRSDGSYNSKRYWTNDTLPSRISIFNKFVKEFQEMNLATPFNMRGRALEDENVKLLSERELAYSLRDRAEAERDEMSEEMNEFKNWRNLADETDNLKKELEIKQKKIKQLAAVFKTREQELTTREKKISDREAALIINGDDIDDLLK